MPRRPVSRDRPLEPTSRACPVGTGFGRVTCRSASPQCGAPGSHVRAAPGRRPALVAARPARPRAVQGVVRALLPGQRLALDALRHLRRAGTEAVALAGGREVLD